MKTLILALMLVTSASCFAGSKPRTAPPIRGWTPEYSLYVHDHITELMLGADLVTYLCPGYTVSRGRDIWASIFQAVAYAESGWNRTDRYVEPGLGTDVVTGKHVVSEGLMQLSYGDVVSYPSIKNCGINWALDKNKADSDPTKTIFDPYINLGCSIGIMDRLLGKHPNQPAMTVLSAYWSTLRMGSRKAQSCRTRVKLMQLYPACGTDVSDC